MPCRPPLPLFSLEKKGVSAAELYMYEVTHALAQEAWLKMEGFK